MLVFFAQLPACLIGMEACGGAHYWARKLQAQGHMVKLMAPQSVKPYVKSNKTDVADNAVVRDQQTGGRILENVVGPWYAIGDTRRRTQSNGHEYLVN